MRSPILPLLLASGPFALGATAQQVRVVAPIGGVTPQHNSEEDLGTPVEMFENPNLDRYLRRAQDLLEQKKYDAAIEVLQNVVDGHTADAPEPAAARPEEPLAPPKTDEKAEKGEKAGKSDKDKPAAKAEKEKPGGKAKPGEKAAARGPRKTVTDLDATRSVFSPDGRVYRPVRRLCQEILARLPAVGIELYRTRYEVPANELLEKAVREGTANGYQQVVDRYFVTAAAGKAMQALADLLMHEGRFRAAAQVLRDLVDLYPEDGRKRLGISDPWCRFKIALCLRLAGDAGGAQLAVQDLAQRHPDESLRIAGELHTIRDLPQSDVFAAEVAGIGPARPDTGPGWLTTSTEALAPLWQFRFVAPEPYRDPKAGNNEGQVMFGGESMSTWMPHANRYGPGTRVGFSPTAPGGMPRAMFFEHYRLRAADALTGLLLREGDGAVKPPNARENYPRVRIAATDFATLRPVEDDTFQYAVIGYAKTDQVSASPEVLKASELIAYRREDGERAWSSSAWLDGEEGLRDVTFLAAPTPCGERLLLPALRNGAYTLQCLEQRTGRPMWHTLLHSGGTPFFKAPGVPVVVQGGIAYVATNAGCIAAVDAFAGELRWIRRYERDDPIRPRPRPKTHATGEGNGVQFLQCEIPGFEPGELVVRDGLVVAAPCDGSMLLCLDGATGQPVWMIDGASRFAPYGTLRQLIGATANSLYTLADKHLVCIDLHGGLVRWCRDLPALTGSKTGGRGRGAIVGDFVVVPGDRELLVQDVAGAQPLRRLPLPAFGQSREPLTGSFHVVSSGPWLAIGYQGGVELFSSVEALRALAAGAADPLLRANLLVHAGAAAEAITVLQGVVRDAAAPAERHDAAAARLLALVREDALLTARAGAAGALAKLDAVLPFATDRKVRLEWHLARLEVCKEAGDLRGHENEQQRLYDYMEGKEPR